MHFCFLALNLLLTQFETGRLVPNTGYWLCCGDPDHFSLYCPSIERRDIFKSELEVIQAQEKQDKAFRNQRRDNLHDQVQQSMQREMKFLTPVEAEEKQLVALASDLQQAFNAPMLVAWLLRHFHEELTMQQGLKYALDKLQDGEGCVLLLRHGLAPALQKIHTHFLKISPEIELLILQCFRQLLDCNFTRDTLLLNLIYNDPEAVGDTPAAMSVPMEEEADWLYVLLFEAMHRNHKSKEHLTQVLRCYMQCCRHEPCRAYLLRNNAIVLRYAWTFTQEKFGYKGTEEMHHAILRLVNWIATTSSRLMLMFEMEALQYSVRCMRKYRRFPQVQAPAIVFLQRLVFSIPSAMELALRLQVIPLVVDAMKILHADQIVQLEALKLISALAKTSEGFQQLSNIPAGWQLVTQGTLKGNELVHDLPGPLNNPGWALGDTPHLPVLEKMKLGAAKLSQTSLQQAPKASWTAVSLRQFMGLSMSGQTLAINTEESTVYFELMNTLDLLPVSGEEKEDWFSRLRKFEKDSEVSIDEMVVTVQEMRYRENLRKKMQSQGVSSADEEAEASVKPIYVHGKRVTAESLQANDVGLEETMERPADMY